jgi:TRAP-type C4-dicarboxylate transport system permease small subunit
MEQLTGGLERVIDRVSTWLAQLAAFSAFLLTVVVTYGVITRFVFNSSQNWTDELASYCLLWMVFLGLTYTLNEGAHIRIDFITEKLPPGARRHLEAAIYGIGAIFGVMLFLGCLSELQNFIRRGTYSTDGMDIPLVWPAVPMVLGAALFATAFIARFLRLVLVGAPTPGVQRKTQAEL